MNRIGIEISRLGRVARAVVVLVVSCALAVSLAVLGGAAGARPHSAYATSATATATQAETYDIIFKLNGGKQAEGQVTAIAKGKTLKVAKLKAPTRDRYKFVGWYANRALTTNATVLEGVSDASKRTVYAKWKLKSYNILYNLNGGTFKGSYTKTVAKNKTVKTSKLVQPTRNGYTFAGWYTDQNLKKTASSVQGVSDSARRTLYAKWSPVKYVISYELNDGEFPSAYPTTYRPSKGLANLPVPERDGYAFIGWYGDAALTDHVTSISANTSGNKKLYARWVERIKVAHHGYTAGGAAANSLDAFKAAHEGGYQYADVDVRFDADGTPVLATADGQVPVKPATPADATTPTDPTTPADPATPVEPSKPADSDTPTDPATPADPAASNDSATPNSSTTSAESSTDSATDSAQPERQTTYAEFTAYLDACKTYGLTSFVELPSDATQTQIEQLAGLVYARRVADAVRWVSASAEQLGYVQARLSRASLVLRVPEVTDGVIQSAEKLVKLGADVSIGTDATRADAAAIAACKAAGLPLGIWTLPAGTDIASYDPYISAFSLK